MSDASAVKVSTQRMRDAAQQISVQTAQITAAMRSAQEMAAGSAGYWNGPAAEMLRTAMRALEAQFAGALPAMQEDAEALRVMAGTYEPAEEDALERAQLLAPEVL